MLSGCIGKLHFFYRLYYVGTNALHRVEANGKHYQAGGYPFLPLTFHSAENAE